MSGEDLLARFQALDIGPERLGLMRGDFDEPYFCTPVGAEVVGQLGVDGIHFCRIPALDPEMIFAVSPTPCGEHYVEPVARDADMFLRLVLACGGASPLEQVSWLSEPQFENLLAEERASMDRERRSALERVGEALDLEPHPAPYAAIKSLQNGFDNTTIPFSEEYYEVTGEPNPVGAAPDFASGSAPLWETEIKVETDISDET